MRLTLAAQEVLTHRQKRATYWSRDGRMSHGLLRARAPFRFRNILTGAAVLAFVGGVYAYSISAVKQDDFSDIPAPSPEQRGALAREVEEVREASLAAREKAAAGGAAAAGQRRGPARGDPGEGRGSGSGAGGGVAGGGAAKGLLSRWIGLEEGLVLDAPAVDRLGATYDRRPTDGRRSV